MVDTKGDLKVLFCSIRWGDKHSSIVDKDVQRQVAFLKRVSEVANRAANRQRKHQQRKILTYIRVYLHPRSPERCQVDLHEVYFGFSRGLLLQLLHGSIATLLISGGDDNMRVFVHQGSSSFKTNTGVAAGDHKGPVGKVDRGSHNVRGRSHCSLEGASLDYKQERQDRL